MLFLFSENVDYFLWKDNINKYWLNMILTQNECSNIYYLNTSAGLWLMLFPVLNSKNVAEPYAIFKPLL